MINTNSLGILGQFYFNIKESFKSIYQNSNFYEKKISKTFNNNFEYKPSPHLLSSIIKYQNKKYKIGFCGDWFEGDGFGRIEGSILSALILEKKIKDLIK